MIGRLLLLTVFTTLLMTGAAAQTTSPFPRLNDPPPRMKDRPAKDSSQDLTLPEEMRIKLAIERADSDYRKTLADAEKLNDMSAEVAKICRERGGLSAEEMKKVSTIEKLAKRILNQAGGDEVEDKTAKAEQKSLADACEQMSVTAAKIRDSMKMQTRFVVSAAVIASSNEVINLAQFIRRSQK
ncbi:MAG TPA: hypothetical protein VF762_20715 [Blastocatellia bacterium]|jgi:hypothetical protein